MYIYINTHKFGGLWMERKYDLVTGTLTPGCITHGFTVSVVRQNSSVAQTAGLLKLEFCHKKWSE